MERVGIIGIDIARNTIRLHGTGSNEATMFPKSLPRTRVH